MYEPKARTEKLIQSTLAKDFRGELVPTEHAIAEAEGRKYENAEQLLSRLKTQPGPKDALPTKRRRRATPVSP
jgi:hypothetical protein